MKILFLNYEYPPLGGGAANATRYILREFSRMPDVEAHLVTSGMGEVYGKEHIGGCVWVHRLPIGKDPKKIHSQSVRDLLVYSFKAWRFSSGLIRDSKKSGAPFERTIAFFGIPCGVLALWFKWRFGIPYVVSLRGSDVPGYSEKYDRLYLFLAWLIRLVWRKAIAAVPNSLGLAELAAKTSPGQVFEIIPNGVDTELFRPDPARRPKDEIVITTGATRLTKRKGVRYLLESVSRIVSDFPQVRLKIMGDGDDREYLESRARELSLDAEVSFLGQVPSDETYRYYQEASIFVLPSLNEGMSNAMLEALAAGLPIVATVTGGTEELVSDGVNGFFVAQQSPEDLAEKLGKLLADESLRVRMGEASRKRAEEMSWKRVAEKFLELCR